MRSACVNGPLAAFPVLVIYVAWCRIAYMGATENAGVENAGVNRMERQPEIISRKPIVTSLDLSLFFWLKKVCLLLL